MTTTNQVFTPEKILLKTFGYSNFRGLQKDVVQSLCNGNDTVALLPTGAGKSICFQVPGLFLGNTTIVVSPLISLMQDQVQALVKKNIPAIALTSHQSQKEQIEIEQNIKNSKYSFVYISPERLLKESFITACQATRISLVAIDEAHCICEWGDEFRPAYKEISAFIKKIKKRPVVAAFTATATPTTVAEIITNLEMEKPKVVQSNQLRTNIIWHYLEVDTPRKKILSIAGILKRFEHQPTIIYANTRVSVEFLYKLLRALFPSIQVIKYHGGLEQSERKEALDKFIESDTCCLVATNAFGMGIDKATVGCVIHAELPGSIEQWYQEVGRAGRGGQRSFSFTLFSRQDYELHTKRILQKDSTHSQKEGVKLDQLWQLAHHTNCKSTLLQQYFGIGESNNCINCDYCCNSRFSHDEMAEWSRAFSQTTDYPPKPKVREEPREPWQQLHTVQRSIRNLIKTQKNKKELEATPCIGPAAKQFLVIDGIL